MTMLAATDDRITDNPSTDNPRSTDGHAPVEAAPLATPAKRRGWTWAWQGDTGQIEARWEVRW